MSEPKQTIHIRIRDLRRERSLTQEELALALGISRQSINAMEAGRCLPSLPVAMQIASFFSVPLHAVFLINEGSEVPSSALIPWSPIQEVLSSLIEEPVVRSDFPLVNLYVRENALYAEVSVPGYRQEDISIEVGEQTLTLTSSITDSTPSSYLQQEFSQPSFQRTVTLPVLVQPERTEALLRQGILLICMPKVQVETPKTARVAIRSLE